MLRRIGGMNASQKHRANVLTREMGCVACRDVRGGYEPPDLHHLTDTGFTISHDHTVPLCPWHHRGIPKNNATASMMSDHFGPSLAKSKSDFTERFGTEAQLLEKTNRWYQANESQVTR